MEEQKVKTYYDVMGDEELGRKLCDGDIITITGISINHGQYGQFVVFETTEGRRYSGATAIIDFALKLLDKEASLPEGESYLPVKVKVIEVVSAVGRWYLRFTEA